MSMELTPEIKSACKQLGYELYKTENTELMHLSRRFGYEPYGYGMTYDNGVKGELITLPEGQNKYNNGVYILSRQKDDATVMQVIIPNTRDKGDMIQKAVDSITTHIKGMNTDDFQLFDYAEMWGYVMAEITLKPLAHSLYPENTDINKAKREQFVMLAMPRLLVNAAHLYVGDELIEEERVNGEPYVIKSMIDQETSREKNKPDNEG